MDSKAKLFGHPIHQMLIVFPLGLLATAVIFDVIHLVTDMEEMARVSYWMIVAGIVGGLVAAPFGWIDWLAIPKNTRAKSIGLYHGVGNVILLLLFIGSWWVRRDLPQRPETFAFVLSFAAAALSLFTAWLGGELVDRLGVGVHEGANVDAPNSLTHENVHEKVR